MLTRFHHLQCDKGVDHIWRHDIDDVNIVVFNQLGEICRGKFSAKGLGCSFGPLDINIANANQCSLWMLLVYGHVT